MEGFREFVLARSAALARTAYLLTGDHHLAEDLLQSALANAYRHWRRIGEGNPEGYVRRAIYHEHISWWRRRRRGERLLADVSPHVAPAPDPTAQATLRLAIERALDQLTARQRAVIVLRYFEDLTEAEVARVLGCTVGTVKRHGHAAIARLRACAPELLRDEAHAEEVRSP